MPGLNIHSKLFDDKYLLITLLTLFNIILLNFSINIARVLIYPVNYIDRKNMWLKVIIGDIQFMISHG